MLDGGRFDTVLCLNILEYVDDPATVLHSTSQVVKPGGSLVILVPQGLGLCGTVDRFLGHKRRFRVGELETLVKANGLQVERVHQINKIGVVAWLLYSAILRQKRISKLTLKLFDKTVWVGRRIDKLLPWRGLSLILVARRPQGPEDGNSTQFQETDALQAGISRLSRT
jgi:SAM-dependent methyltransferase